jgi:hypothetical protein
MVEQLSAALRVALNCDSFSTYQCRFSVQNATKRVAAIITFSLPMSGFDYFHATLQLGV